MLEAGLAGVVEVVDVAGVVEDVVDDVVAFALLRWPKFGGN